jgi:hypothetical protein
MKPLFQKPLVPPSLAQLKEVETAMRTRNGYGQKSWKFPKLHVLSHAFPGIRDKAVTANYNTKPNEHEHRDTRLAYERSNKKDVAKAVSPF